MAYTWNGTREEPEQTKEEAKKEKALAYYREWYARNRDHARAKQRERYAKKKAAKPLTPSSKAV